MSLIISASSSDSSGVAVTAGSLCVAASVLAPHHSIALRCCGRRAYWYM